MKHDLNRHGTSARGCRALRGSVAMALLLLATLALALLAGASTAEAVIIDNSADPAWTGTIAGPGSTTDEAYDVALAGGGVTFVTGKIANDDISLTKFVDGVISWTKVYDSPYHAQDAAYKLAVGRGGVVYTVGSSYRASWDNSDLILIKWSAASGKVLWARRYDGPAHRNDSGRDVGVDRRGNVTVTGTSDDGNGKQDWLVRNYSPSGAVRWTKRLDVGIGAHPAGLFVAGDDSVYIAGYEQRSIPNVGIQNRSVTMRFSPSGRSLWKKTYLGPEGSGAFVYALAKRPGGGVYACGYAITAASGADGLVVGYSSTGTRKAFVLGSAAGNQEFRDVAVTSTGYVVAVGSSSANDVSDPYYVVYKSDGTVSSSGTAVGSGVDSYRAVAADGFGGFYIAGSRHLPSDDQVLTIMRRSTITNGGMFDFAWGAGYASSETRPTSIAVRGSTVSVAGLFRENPSGPNIDQVVLTWVW